MREMDTLQTDLAPVVLFVYNRPAHTLATMEALVKNTLASSSVLYVFSDGPKNAEDEKKVKEVRRILGEIKGMKNVVIFPQPQNQGLARSVINGVSQVFDQYNRVIVLEDDIVTTPDFLEYMNASLDAYENSPEIFSISAYTPGIKVPDDYPHHVYLSPRISSWGWGVWKDRWARIDWEVKDFDSFIRSPKAIKTFNLGGEDCTPMLLNQINGKIDSWAIRFNYACYKQKGFNIYPVGTKIENIGFDGSGTHTHNAANISFSLRSEAIVLPQASDLQADERILVQVRKKHQRSVTRRCMNTFKIIQYRLTH